MWHWVQESGEGKQTNAEETGVGAFFSICDGFMILIICREKG
jgi:hypothetical protein